MSGFRFDDCRVRHGLLLDSYTGRGAGRGFTVRISTTSTEQVHCYPYPPLTTIAFIFTQIDYITHPQGVWPVESDTVVVYSQV